MKMDEHQVDDYVGRSLKNWAVQQPLPVDGRERLLRAARIRPEMFDGRRLPEVGKFLKSFFNAQPALEYQPDWLFVPFTQSRLWSFHVATTRLTT